MTTNEGRCEPPPEWREKDGWHWVQDRTGDPVVRRWLAGPYPAWRHLSMPSTAELAYQAGFRYLAPVTPPQTVATLVEALEGADQFIRNGIELCFIRMPDPDTPDPALETPGKVARALALYRGEAGR